MNRYNIAKPLLKLLLIKKHLINKTDFTKTIVYHDVSSNDFNNFKNQIEFVHKKYGFINPKDFDNTLFDRNNNHDKILLTFDDGFKSNIIIAKKILSVFNIKALFFIPTGFINIKQRDEQKIYINNNFFNNRLSNAQISDEMAPMSWDDLKYLLEDGHLIGAHTINHNKLSNIISEESLNREIIGCGEELKNKLGTQIDHFAYTFGDINSINKRALNVIKNNYKYCHSAIRGNNHSNSSLYALLRDPISPQYPIKYLQFIIENGFGLLYRRKSNILNQLVYD